MFDRTPNIPMDSVSLYGRSAVLIVARTSTGVRSSAGKGAHDGFPWDRGEFQLTEPAVRCSTGGRSSSTASGDRGLVREAAEPRQHRIHAPSPSRSNTGDKLRGSVACAGLVSFIPWLDVLLHSASQAGTLVLPARRDATPLVSGGTSLAKLRRKPVWPLSRRDARPCGVLHYARLCWPVRR